MKEKELQIIEKALELFRNYGIKSVTMDDLSKEIAISKKTLYNYFSDKADMVKKVIAHDFNERWIKFNNIFSGNKNAVEQLYSLNQFIQKEHKSFKPSMMFDLKKYYPEVSSEFQMKRRHELFESLLKNIVKGKEEGLYRANLDENIIAKLHVFRSEHIIESDIFTMEELTSNQFVNEIFKYHLHGIVSDKGLEILKKLFK